MAWRFLADADLKRAIVDGVLRREDADFKLAESVPLEGLPDREVLAYAAAEGRVLVTHDMSTMPVHFAAFIRGRESPGVLIIPQHVPVGRVIDAIIDLIRIADTGDMRNMIRLVPSLAILSVR